MTHYDCLSHKPIPNLVKSATQELIENVSGNICFLTYPPDRFNGYQYIQILVPSVDWQVSSEEFKVVRN